MHPTHSPKCLPNLALPNGIALAKSVKGTHQAAKSSWKGRGISITLVGGNTGGRGGITQGVSFEFFESFLLIYSQNTHWVNFGFFQKLLTTLIKTYSQGNFRN